MAEAGPSLGGSLGFGEDKRSLAFDRLDKAAIPELPHGTPDRFARGSEFGDKIKLCGQAAFRRVGAVIYPRRKHVRDRHVNKFTTARREPGGIGFRHEVTIDTALPQPTLR